MNINEHRQQHMLRGTFVEHCHILHQPAQTAVPGTISPTLTAFIVWQKYICSLLHIHHRVILVANDLPGYMNKLGSRSEVVLKWPPPTRYMILGLYKQDIMRGAQSGRVLQKS
jgi:hypothetical protein